MTKTPIKRAPSRHLWFFRVLSLDACTRRSSVLFVPIPLLEATLWWFGWKCVGSLCLGVFRFVSRLSTRFCTSLATTSTARISNHLTTRSLNCLDREAICLHQLFRCLLSCNESKSCKIKLSGRGRSDSVFELVARVYPPRPQRCRLFRGLHCSRSVCGCRPSLMPCIHIAIVCFDS